MAKRFLDAGRVSGLRSQTIYHGLAYARTESTPDTIVVASPADPYVCVGYHQDVDRELDVPFCESQGLPILRRETGGGAVYLDRDQLFVQWIMGPESLPRRLDQRFALFAEPLVATYRELGIAAEFRPVNDVHVDGKKIVGTGAAHIGNAEVLVGNFLFDFDTEVMTQVLRAPSPAFRAQLRSSLRKYMTSIRQELGTMPDHGIVAAIYRRECERTLGGSMLSGDLTGAELTFIEQSDERLSSLEFQRQAGGLKRHGVKIHEDVYVVDSSSETDIGTLRITARVRRGVIEEIALECDPALDTNGLADRLRGAVHADKVRTVVAEHLDRVANATADTIDDWVRAIAALDPSIPSPP